DAIYFTGGHAVMWDFPDDEGLQKITHAIWEGGGIVSSVCHGYCGLLNTMLPDGGDEATRGALREGVPAVRLPCRGRRPSGDRPESLVRKGDGPEGGGPSLTLSSRGWP